MAEVVEIFVLNRGYGESIVIKLPRDVWGVVDCYTPSLDDVLQNPTVRLLRQNDVRSLAFVCLTHPHEDHYRGLGQLFDSFEVDEFWKFGGLWFGDLDPRYTDDEVVCTLLAQAAQISDSPGPRTAAVEELKRIHCITRQRADAGKLILRHVVGIQNMYPLPMTSADGIDSPKISSIAPSGQAKDRYERAIRRQLADRYERSVARDQSHHNLISIGLTIKFGAATIILGGDMELGSWEDALRDCGPENLDASMVKVSHHGSATGFVKEAWAAIASVRKPVAIVTPYHRFRLPDPHVVDKISQYCRQVVFTCLPQRGTRQPSNASAKPSLISTSILKVKPIDVQRDGTLEGMCHCRISMSGEVQVFGGYS